MRARSLVTLLLTSSLVATGCPGPGSDESGPPVAEPFTLIVLPDTQYYALSYPSVLDAMLAWAAGSAEQGGFPFLLHEGDLTHENTQEEWDNIRSAFDQIEGVLPYAACVGNHDLDDDGDDARFDATFPIGAVSDQEWFGGSHEPDSLANAWFSFEAGGTPWLVLSLTYAADSEQLDWADQLLAEHDDHRVIVLTHAYMAPDASLSTIGVRFWQILQNHPQVSFVLNGHYTDGEAAYLASQGEYGNTVHQLFFNMQTRLFGGEGYLRLMSFDPEAGSVDVKTYSPWLDWYQETEEHRFVLEGVDLGAP